MIFENVEKMVLATLTEGRFIETKGHQTPGDGGGRQYLIQTPEEYDDTPDGEVINGVYVGGDWALANGNIAKMVVTETTVNPKWFGYRGLGVIPAEPENPILDPTIDESDAIEKMMDWINRPGSPQDLGRFSSGDPKSKAGAYSIEFPARSICNISRTMFTGFRRVYVDVNFNGTEVRPLSPIPAIYSEGFLCEVSNLVVRYNLADQSLPVNQQDGARSGYLTWEQIYDGAQAGYESTAYGIAIAGNRPGQGVVSFVTYRNIIVFGGWRAFNADGNEIVFGCRFERCNGQGCMDWGFVIESTAIGTTNVFERCWVENLAVDTVQHNGNTYLPVQHVPAAPVIEPGVTAGWEDYWFLSDPTLDPPANFPAWQSGQFYRAFGKGYFIRNQSTTSMINCSMDGGTDYEPGYVLNMNQRPNVHIDNFQLERHYKLYSDRASILVRLGNLDINHLYIADPRYRIAGQDMVQNGGRVFKCRINHTSTTALEPGAGADWHRYWEEQSVINNPPTTEPAWALGTDYVNGFSTYIGGQVGAKTVSLGTVEEVTLESLPPAVNPVKKWINTKDMQGVVLDSIQTSLVAANSYGIQYPNTRIARINERFNVGVTDWQFQPDYTDTGNIILLGINAAGTYTALIDDTEAPIGTTFTFRLLANDDTVSTGKLNISFKNTGELFPGPSSFNNPAARGFIDVTITKTTAVGADGRWYYSVAETI